MTFPKCLPEANTAARALTHQRHLHLSATELRGFIVSSSKTLHIPLNRKAASASQIFMPFFFFFKSMLPFV